MIPNSPAMQFRLYCRINITELLYFISPYAETLPNPLRFHHGSRHHVHDFAFGGAELEYVDRLAHAEQDGADGVETHRAVFDHRSGINSLKCLTR